MLGNLLTRIRLEKGISKTELSQKTKINIGHLTHIEKGTRNPSHKALQNLSSALDVPFEPLYHTYDKTLDEKQLEYKYIDKIAYNKIPAISNIDSYIDCPTEFSNASFALKISDNSMNPIFKEGDYAFIEINGLIKHREIGFFRINNEFMIRKLIYRRNHFILKANDKSFKDIVISDEDDFQIIGKVYI